MISIVIPTYNQKPAFLAKAVNSALDQTVRCEVIVVDDGSDTPVPPGGPVRIIRHEKNKGIAHALNSGIAAATGEWICWLSSDDYLFPHKAKRQLERTEEVGAKCSFHRYQTQAGITELPHRPMLSIEKQMQRLAWCCYINGSTTMIHRSVFDDVGLYNPEYKYGQDWEMWCRIGRKYQWYGIDEVLGFRWEGDNLTAKIEADPEMKRVRDEENARINEMYR